MTDRPDPRSAILVVEDEALVAMMVEDMLAEAGFHVVWAPDGICAPSSHAPATAPRAAVVDLRLARGLDGRDILRRLREGHPEMPVVVITGYDPTAPEADLRGLGGPTARLRKPFESEALLENLAALIDGLPPPVMFRRRASDVPAAASPSRGRRVCDSAAPLPATCRSTAYNTPAAVAA